MELISPIDAVFLLAESREHPMHVGSLQLFEAPEDAGPDFARHIHEKLLVDNEFHPTFRKRQATWLGAPRLAWTQAEGVELSYHLRRSALPSPGHFDQLLELASDLHSTLLDRHRPLWEIHLVEGLSDGRFAVYSKMHHALIDGVTAQRVLAKTLTNDPHASETRVPWNLPRSNRRAEPPGSLAGGIARNLLSAAGSGPAVLRVARAALLRQQLTMPFEAPRSMFNVPIGGARRCAVRSWPLERVRQVNKATGTTVNDVVLTMSAGALRGYLIEQNALPDKPLIAMVPVSLRTDEDATEADGVKVGAILCNLGTDIADPIERLRVVSDSMRRSKEVYNSLSPTQTMALSGLMLSPLALTMLPGMLSLTNPPFNIVISNVPGAKEPQYWNGARLDATYPMSIPCEGQAVNITLTTNADNLDFGLVGCRRSVPRLHSLLDHLENSLTELEQAAV
ncbi:wax ester/triacylglycerol synthase family O-acyltransferase [Nocardia sp. NBC_00565]|uniref:WS/DGAT/MGAT family O-acyltransferase n=1 Tax=Nocardia sp. NBC_00565 TaxID=2975993 RepID=UPI002E81B9DB|nr:wax ester/triacylglycerol synthase family O-acyltransferase [Nocardia sp. NBC_00565]WUC02206.1 wax ester/triacylglycerol synthase family O-acyltransferase [Nocardia sp. NBC_00565]